MSESTTNHQIIGRVQALLRKAESSEFPDEADALLAKAQELIARHAIDQSELADPASVRPVDHEEIDISGSYAYERVMLWGVVAGANGCRVLSHRVYGTRKVQRISVIGRPHDRELTKLLATSLEQQALSRLPTSRRSTSRRSTSRLPGSLQAGGGHDGSLVRRRRSFLFGFASEVDRRLSEANAAVTKQAGHERSAATALALVDELEQYMTGMGDVVRDTSKTSIDATSFDQGSSAATSADLGQARVANTRPQLPPSPVSGT